MNANAEAIRKLLFAHFKGDESTFRTVAWEVVEHERRVNRAVYAAELERILAEANVPPPSRKEVLQPLPGLNGSVPRDKDRNAPLIEASQPQVGMDELVLSSGVRQGMDRIIQEWRQAETLHAHGLRPAAKVLFFGPPGCGKSLAAGALAKELYLPLTTVRFDAVVSSYLGETAANLRKVFDYARTRPMVLFFDEFDAIGKHRTAMDEHGELKRVVNSFLQLLDGFRADVLTLAATNHQGLLDSALWRRFDEVVRFPLPQGDEIESLLTKHFRQIPVSRSVRLTEVAKKLEGMSHADVERVAVEAVKQAILAGQKQVESDMILASIARLLDRIEAIQDGQPHGEAPKRSGRTPRKRKAD